LEGRRRLSLFLGLPDELRLLPSLLREHPEVFVGTPRPVTTDALRTSSAPVRARRDALEVPRAPFEVPGVTLRTRKGPVIASRDALPIPDDTLPIPDDALPIPDDTLPIPDDTLPIPDDALPTPDDALPTPDDTLPIPDDALPLLENALCVRPASRGRLRDAPSVLRAPRHAPHGPEATPGCAPRARTDRMRLRTTSPYETRRLSAKSDPAYFRGAASVRP
jgi:hypothetical protein